MISSEDMLNGVNRLNKLLEIQEQAREAQEEVQELVNFARLVITGADAVNLYPSLNKISTAATIREEALKTKVKWENINWSEAA